MNLKLLHKWGTLIQPSDLNCILLKWILWCLIKWFNWCMIAWKSSVCTVNNIDCIWGETFCEILCKMRCSSYEWWNMWDNVLYWIMSQVPQQLLDGIRCSTVKSQSEFMLLEITKMIETCSRYLLGVNRI